MFPKETIVEVIANNHFGWEAQYQAFSRGERRLYKIIRQHPKNDFRWGPEEAKYTCIMINEKGKQRGSWHYRLYESEVRPVRSEPINLEDYM